MSAREERAEEGVESSERKKKGTKGKGKKDGDGVRRLRVDGRERMHRAGSDRLLQPRTSGSSVGSLSLNSRFIRCFCVRRTGGREVSISSQISVFLLVLARVGEAFGVCV